MNAYNKKGLTLVEVIVAMALLAIVIGIFSSMLYTGLKSRNSNREKLELLALTTSVVDDIKANQRSSWMDVNGLKMWLAAKGYVMKSQDVYSRTQTDSNNISYEIDVSINKNIDITGLFELSVSVKSPTLAPAKIVTRLRGA